MSRLVQPTRIPADGTRDGLEGVEGATPPANPAPAKTASVKKGDTYLERVAKYVPAEVVAFFIFANLILKQADKPDALMAGFSVVSVSMAVFVCAWLFVPVYIARIAGDDDAWVTNAVVATLLFPVWAYAVEGVGPVHVVPFDGGFASIALGAASLASGVVKPRDRSTAPQGGGGPKPPPPADPSPQGSAR